MMIDKLVIHRLLDLISKEGKVKLKYAHTNRIECCARKILSKSKHYEKILNYPIGYDGKYGVSRESYYPDIPCVNIILPYGHGRIYSDDKEFLNNLKSIESSHYDSASIGELIKSNIDKVYYIAYGNRFLEEVNRYAINIIKHNKEWGIDEEETNECIRLKNEADRIYNIKSKIYNSYREEIEKRGRKLDKLLRTAMVNIDLFTTLMNLEITSRKVKTKQLVM